MLASLPPTPSTVDTLDDVFPDPSGVIAALVADLPAPTPECAARVSSLLGGAR